MHTSSILAATLAVVLSFPAIAQNQPGAHFIENWDLDENGSVSIEEARERRGDIFTTFDANDDGVLTAEEYVMFDEAREADMQANSIGQMNGGGQGKGMGFGMGDHGAAMSMTRQNADLDGDGRVTRDEFLAGVDLWFPQQDRNGDGLLTQDDFGRM